MGESFVESSHSYLCCVYVVTRGPDCGYEGGTEATGVPESPVGVRENKGAGGHENNLAWVTDLEVWMLHKQPYLSPEPQESGK